VAQYGPRVAARRDRGALALGVVGASVLLVAGCGGGSRQDADETATTYRLRIVHASFPPVQTIARPTQMVLQVRNVGPTTVPNVAVTIDSFDYASDYAELASAQRPIWVIERGPGAIARPPVQSQEVSTPGGGQTAYVNTWALGQLAPGQVRTFAWLVVPVKSGAHVVHYAVSAGLAGKAKARTLLGGLVQGHFGALIAPRPPKTHLNPDTGKVEPGPLPTNP
jgi:hypothetical protein